MATCHGKWSGPHGQCNSTLLRCKKCGNIGCNQRECSNRAFDGPKCLKCGAVGQYEPLR